MGRPLLSLDLQSTPLQKPDLLRSAQEWAERHGALPNLVKPPELHSIIKARSVVPGRAASSYISYGQIRNGLPLTSTGAQGLQTITCIWEPRSTMSNNQHPSLLLRCNCTYDQISGGDNT
ncbi:hypothetical protein RSOLAG1IB_10947 [Rhizoctonia solani AG-1 IB]|uniref:Uncharacterized protein n=1 Tax=Thanatephorus cucumeris (strain AG1-IB / isolate 7/3/14) TaxID=1108050 RepID=A0A0B7G4C8_THACB|nr:hypothetical protein RSOLAG1IB_10947 [Rhizoctonia solani AG-1 IB]